MVIKTGKEKEEDISEQMNAGNIQRTKKYKYLEVTINEQGNLKAHCRIKTKVFRCKQRNRD